MSGYVAPLPWLRLWTEFANDPKVQRLSEVMQRRYVMILCFTGQRLIPTNNDEAVAFALRVNAIDAAETKKVLLDARLIRSDWYPRGWVARQPKGDHTGSRRQRKYRASLANREVGERESVTAPSRNASRHGDAAEGEGDERERRLEKIRSEEDRPDPCIAGGQLPATTKQEEVSSTLSPALKSPKSPRSSATRKNGDFEAINHAVLMLVERKACEADDYEHLSRCADITVAQARKSVEQLRERNKIPSRVGGGE